MPVNRTALLANLKELLASKTTIDRHGPKSEAGQAWLASVRAHLEQVDPVLGQQFGHWMFYIVMPLSSYTLGPLWANMQAALRTAIARLELEAPQASARAYGPGEAFNVYTDLAEIISAAKESVFIVDPYANEEVFALYLAKVGAGVHIRLLTRSPSAALTLVATKFAARPGVQFSARATSQVHDRVVFIDSTDCWVLGQSIKDAAARKPTYLVPVDAVSDMARLYDDAWQSATPYP